MWLSKTFLPYWDWPQHVTVKFNMTYHKNVQFSGNQLYESVKFKIVHSMHTVQALRKLA